MDADVIKGLFAAGGTAAGAIFSTIIKSYFENKNLFTMSKGRQRALTGIWRGTVSQAVQDGGDLTYNVDLDLAASKKKISGKGKIFVGEEVYQVALTGAFRNDKFLRMEYQNINQDIVQFGAFVFELSADSKKLTGRVVGYGHKAERVVHGSVSLQPERS